jgi:hypothetical protein
MDVTTEGWTWMPLRIPLEGVSLEVEVKRVEVGDAVKKKASGDV